MKFTITQSALQGIMKRCASITSKSISTVTEYALVTVNNGIVKFETDNLDIRVSVSRQAATEQNGEALIKASLIVTIAATASGDIHFEVNKNKATITSGNSVWRTSVYQDMDGFPPARTLKDAKEITVKDLAFGINQVIWAASKDEARYLLNGVCLQKDRLVATDGRALAIFNMNLDVDQGIILPTPIASAIKTVIGDMPATLIYDDRAIHVKTSTEEEDIEIQCKILEGKFPDVNQVVPKKQDTFFMVSPQDFIDTIRCSASVIKEDKHSSIMVSASQDKGLLISSSSENDDFSGTIGCETESEIAFMCNATYITEAFKRCLQETAKVSQETDKKPIVISSDNFLSVIMPIAK